MGKGAGGIHLEALAYCILWAALALFGLDRLGWKAGLGLSLGLFLVVMPVSALILTRTGNFAAERTVRWGILAAAAIILMMAMDAN